MRTLLYVPIIHTSADFGFLAEDISKIGITDLGERVWEEHMKEVEGFWDAIANYFNSIDVSGLKIYQDGMVAEGEIGHKIVEEDAKSGSKNYELLLSLLQRGAILVKTEDFNLVMEERDRLLVITQAKSITQKIKTFMKYKLIKSRLLNRRDNCIVKRIDETLNPGEKGVLFIGAYHNIRKRLSKSIQITEIKDIGKVKEYQRLLLFYEKHREQFEELSKYLISKVE